MTGSVTTNTIGQPDPTTTENINSLPAIVWGTLSLQANRGFTVEGNVQTSHGVVDTKVVQSIDFSNAQKYYVRTDGSIYDQYVGQNTTISSATTTTSGAQRNHRQQAVLVAAGFDLRLQGQRGWLLSAVQPDSPGLHEERAGEAERDCRHSPARFRMRLRRPTRCWWIHRATLPRSGQASTETYQYSDSKGACWNETINASAGNLTVGARRKLPAP